MKTKWVIFATMMLSIATISARLEQDAKLPETDDKTHFSITERGAHHRVWSRVTQKTNALGQVRTRTNSYTEVATGMHFLNKEGKWEEAREEIEILSHGKGAMAGKGQHKVIFPANTEGLIEFRIPEGRWLRSRVWGLAYFDSATGESVLLAEVRKSEGQVIGENIVNYPDAFTEFTADLRYTYTRAGFEQDVVLREQPPEPKDFGLDPRTTRLQVLTEFVNSPEPVKTGRQVGGMDDETLNFGAMSIGAGKAFSTDAANAFAGQMPVSKAWSHIEDRVFLVEEVRYEVAAVELNKLPRSRKYEGAGLQRRGRGAGVLAALKSLMPKRYAQSSTIPTSQLKLMARAASETAPGFVLDYQIMSAGTNFTFAAGKTYLISSPVLLSGTTTLEGGAVIKFANPTNTYSLLSLHGPLECKTGPYSMAIFTSANDNSVGESISGSTGTPSINPTFMIEAIGNGDTNGVWELDHVRMSYGLAGLVAYDGRDVIARNCQLVKNTYGIGNASYVNDEWLGNVTVENSLFSECSVPFYVCDKFVGVNVTVDGFTNLCLSYDGFNSMSVTNSVIVGVGDLFGAETGSTNLPVPAFSHTVFAGTNSGLFAPVGAGRYYLTLSSTNHDVGTTNIGSNLLATLAQTTTHPPIHQTNNITTDTVFYNQAARDSDTPDLGYHYDPMDYLVGCMVTNATVSLTNGAVVGYYNHLGLWLNNESRLISEGHPLNYNRFIFYTFLQEQAIDLGQYDRQSSLPFNPWHSDATRRPEVVMRFTTLTAPQGANYILYAGLGDWDLKRWEFRDCEFFGNRASIFVYGFGTNSLSRFINNVVDDAYIWMDVEAAAGTTIEVRNNLFITRSAGWGNEIWDWETGGMVIKDNVFDRGFVFIGGDMGHNAYLNGCEVWSDIQTNDHVLTNFTWCAGPLGNYYQSPTSALINSGSQTASASGLYHYTATTDLIGGWQIKETNSVVDIGYHYVVVNPSGDLIDTDGDGLPDYSEDGNGNGLTETNETSSTDYYNGILPSIGIVSGNYQIGPTNTILPVVLKVVVLHTNNSPLANAPLTFSVAEGGGTIGFFSAGTTNNSVQTVTDSSGHAEVLLKLPATNGLTISISVIAQSSTNTVGTNFVAMAGVMPMVAAGDGRVMQLLPTGKIVGWGENNYGQLGDFTFLRSEIPVHVVGLTNIVQIATGPDHSFAIDFDKNLWAWGKNESGQLGNGNSTNCNLAVQVVGMTNSVLAVAGGYAHSLAIKTNGTVWEWGSPFGEIEAILTPTHVPGLTNAISVAAGEAHSLVLLGDGTVWSWGSNGVGQLGDGTGNDTNAPVRVSGLSNIVAICSGSAHNMALESNGVVWAWGLNNYGQVSDEISGDGLAPVMVTGVTNIIGISAGEVHSIAVDADGQVWTWGDNHQGQLGNGEIIQDTFIPRSSVNSRICRLDPIDRKDMSSMWVAGKECEECPPFLLVTISNIVQVSASVTTSSAMDSAGKVWVWGNLNPWPVSTNQYVDYYEGQLPNLQIVSGNSQTTYGSLEFSEPLVFQVADTNNVPLTNAPVSVEVISGDMELRTETGGLDYKGLRLTTDTNGLVSLIGYADREINITNCVIKILAASQEKVVRLDFNETLIPPVFPTIAFTNPGTFLISPVNPSNITLTVDVQDADGFVQRVDYQIFDESSYVPLSSVMATPFPFTMTNVSPGLYRFQAVAVDNVGLLSDTAFQDVYVLLDMDNDGMPDDWEAAYGLNPTNAVDAAFDPDEDLRTNLQEYQEGTNPNDFYNGVLPQLVFVSGTNQGGIPNSFLQMPLIIRVTGNSSEPLSNAPIVFTASIGSVRFASTTNSALESELTLKTGSNGVASVWIFFQTNLFRQCEVFVRAWSVSSYVEIAAAFNLISDTDLDGLSDAHEIEIGTNPLDADTDNDGVPDGLDPFPLDPTRWLAPSPDAGDTTPPSINLIEPGAVNLLP